MLAGLPNREDQLRLARRAVEEGLNVRQVEALAAQIKIPGKKRKKVPAVLEPELKELQDRLLERTGMRATLTGNVNKGKIVLQYGSLEELNRLNELLERV